MEGRHTFSLVFSPGYKIKTPAIAGV